MRELACSVELALQHLAGCGRNRLLLLRVAKRMLTNSLLEIASSLLSRRIAELIQEVVHFALVLAFAAER